MPSGRIVVSGFMPAVDQNGVPIPGARLFVYQNRTTTLATVYADSDMTVPIPNPVIANASGEFPFVWQDTDLEFSVTINSDRGQLVSYDDIKPSEITGDLAAAALAGAEAGAVAAGEIVVTEPRKQTAASLAAVAAVDSPVQGLSVYLGDAGRAGQFVWRTGNYTARSAADPAGAIYVPHTTVPLTTGCWVRDRLGMNLDVRWTGALGDGVADDGPAIQAALNLAKALPDVGGIYLPTPPVKYRVATPLVYASRKPIAIVGQGGTQGTFVGSGQNGTLVEYVGPPTSNFLRIETDSPVPGLALAGVRIEGITFYTQDQAKTSGGVGLAMRGVYGAVHWSDVSIVGFATGLLSDDNPASLAPDKSTRNGKFNFTDVRISRAAYRRMDLRATCASSFYNLMLLEEPALNYESDLHIGEGTNGRSTADSEQGRSDDLIFYACKIAGSPGNGDPNTWPDYNVNVTGRNTLYVVFNQCAIEQSRLAGVNVNLDRLVPEGFTNVTLNDCWFNGHLGFAVDSLRACTMIRNPRVAASGLNGNLAIRFRGHTDGSQTPSIGGGVWGGRISFGGAAGIGVNNGRNVSIRDVQGSDHAGGGRPVVLFGANSVENSALNIMPDVFTEPRTLAWVDNGTLNAKSVLRGEQTGFNQPGGPTFNRGLWTRFPATIVVSQGALGAGAGGRFDFLQQGDTVFFEFDISIPDRGTAGVTLSLTMPSPAPLADQMVSGAGRDVTGTTGGLTWTINGGQGARLEIVKATDNSFPAVSGSRLTGSGFYRTA